MAIAMGFGNDLVAHHEDHRAGCQSQADPQKCADRFHQTARSSYHYRA